MQGRFLSESTLADLRSSVSAAQDDGLDALFVGDGPLGDAAALAAAICTWSTGLLVGVRLTYGPPDRHPSLVARELATLDQIGHGRTMATLGAPFADDLVDVVTLWRAMWQESPLTPFRLGGPPIALDLTDGTRPPPAVLAVADLVLLAGHAPVPGALPAGIDVCQIQNA